jgi:anaerobic selenocysteine-containing dehydrogenase
MAYCPLEVTIEDGRAVRALGNKASPIYGGFSCPKGRAIPELMNDPSRLLHSRIRRPDGSYAPIRSDDLIDDVADRLGRIIAEHGPQSVAVYAGGGAYEHQATGAIRSAFMQSIGSSLVFTPATIDQPGQMIARALHGDWRGGRMRSSTWEAYLMVGGNPVISKQYFGQNPGQQLKRVFNEQAKLIVVDPRRTETARRAHVHLQVIPGEDATVIAGLIHLVIAADHVDQTFVDENASGFAALRDSVSRYTPAYVAARAGVDEAGLREAARILGEARSADYASGTGPAMAPRGNLTCYLISCLQTIRGHWARAGDEAARPSVLRPPKTFRAEPAAPRQAWGFGHQFQNGMRESVCGLPVSALPNEILTPGPSQIRALFMHGGAMMSWPEQELTLRAFKNLELLVVPDNEMSATARVATHVVAVKTQLEVPVMSQHPEIVSSVHDGYGWEDPYGAYGPTLVDPPEGADVIEPWQIYYRIAARLGLPLSMPAAPSGEYKLAAGGAAAVAMRLIPLDAEPTTDDIYEWMCAGSRIPLAEVKRYPEGHVFEEAREIVQPRRPECTDRLEIGNPDMLDELAAIRAEEVTQAHGAEDGQPLLLIPRRMQNVTNAHRERSRESLHIVINPAFMNPSDMAAHGVRADDLISIKSRHGEITGVVAEDRDLRPGVLAMTHSFGRNPGEASDPRRDGANTNRLLSMTEGADPYSGIPLMGAVPIQVTKVASSPS